MNNFFYQETSIFPEVFVSVFLGLIGLQLYLRIFGRRSLAKIDGIDFASTIAIGSVLASMMVSTSVSIVRGLTVIGAILLFQTLIILIYNVFPSIKNILTNDPIFLIKDGEIQTQNLKSTGMSYENLMEKLRVGGVAKLSEVGAAIFETTGDVSIIKSKDIDSEILSGVKN